MGHCIMKISIGVCSAPENKIDKTGHINFYKDYDDCVFKAAQDYRNPDILIADTWENVGNAAYNYVLIDGVGYYFIRGVEFTRNNLMTLHCSIDYLMTYNKQILSAPGIIDRSEKGYNLYFDDPYVDTLSYTSIDNYKDFEATDGLRYYGIIVGK